MENTTQIQNIEERKVVKFTRSKRRLLFYILLMVLPVLQFTFFYIYINFNSIIMAFKVYDPITETFGFAGLDNFKMAWAIIADKPDLILNSFWLYLVNLVIVMGLALVFSYYIAKNYIFSGLFRVVLYMPQLVSSVVFVLLYTTITTDVTRVLFGKEILMEVDSQYAVILLFNIWLGFGSNVMLFTGSMAGINGSIIESSHIDGVNIVQEFIYITIPSIWGTFVTFVVTGLAGIFLNQMHLYTFFGYDLSKAHTQVFGYYFYLKTATGAQEWAQHLIKGTSLQTLSALGVMTTVVLVPITLIIRKLLEKYGPRTD